MKASISVAIAGFLCFSTYVSAQPNSPRLQRDEVSRQYARCELEAIRLGTADYWHYLSACMRAETPQSVTICVTGQR
jgi:hypothetical protein